MAVFVEVVRELFLIMIIYVYDQTCTSDTKANFKIVQNII